MGNPEGILQEFLQRLFKKLRQGFKSRNPLEILQDFFLGISWSSYRDSVRKPSRNSKIPQTKISAISGRTIEKSLNES